MKKILAIDGGGIRGIIPALVLDYIERATRKPTNELFDLIAGTSTGGIIAAGLVLPGKDGKAALSAHDLFDLYLQWGREIFSRSAWKSLVGGHGIFDKKYDSLALHRTLKRYGFDREIEMALTNTMLTAYDIRFRRPIFVKSWRRETNAISGIDGNFANACLATAAAPTYFQPQGGFIDGGVHANNPAMCAFSEAKKLWTNEDVLVVSLGTGNHTRPIDPDEARDWGALEWCVPLISIFMDGQGSDVDYQLRNILGEKYFRFQCELGIANDDMDDASMRNIKVLIGEAENLIRENGVQLDKAIDLLEDCV